MSDSMPRTQTPPENATAAVILGDGSVFWGQGVGAEGNAVGEVCFNTSLTGYQEIMTDPSYAGQIITFTFPHIGNVGTNDEDFETTAPAARGCVLRADITDPANWRSACHYDEWLRSHGLSGIAGVDTRHLTRRIRDLGAPHATICHSLDGQFDLLALQAQAHPAPGGAGGAIDVGSGEGRPYMRGRRAALIGAPASSTTWSVRGGGGREGSGGMERGGCFREDDEDVDEDDDDEVDVEA